MRDVVNGLENGFMSRLRFLIKNCFSTLACTSGSFTSTSSHSTFDSRSEVTQVNVMATKSEKEILEYDGSYNAGRFDGNGSYESSHGGRYIGDFVDGLYHGEGILYVKNGFFEGDWEEGRLVDGKFHFRDGLEAPHGQGELDEWEYCSEEDRRFHSEILADVPKGEMKFTSARVGAPLPKGCFDAEEGYYDPSEKAIFDYTSKDVVRYPEDEERKWIVEHCRKGS